MSTEEQQTLTGGWTANQIEKARKQHGRLMLVETTGPEGEQLAFWFRRPDMKVMGAVTKLLQTDPLQANLVLFRNCLINQEQVKWADDVEVMMAVMPHLEKIVEVRAAEVRNF